VAPTAVIAAVIVFIVAFISSQMFPFENFLKRRENYKKIFIFLNVLLYN
jgi:hypothetical protein